MYDSDRIAASRRPTNVVNMARARLEREIAERQRMLDQLEVVPDLDEFPNETVIRVRVGDRYGRESYTYVLLKVVVDSGRIESGRPQNVPVTETRWYFTGRLRGRPANETWVRSDTLASWLTSNDKTIESWELMLPPPAEPAIRGFVENIDGTAPRVFITDSVTPGDSYAVMWNDDAARWEI